MKPALLSGIADVAVNRGGYRARGGGRGAVDRTGDLSFSRPAWFAWKRAHGFHRVRADPGSPLRATIRHVFIYECV